MKNKHKNDKLSDRDTSLQNRNKKQVKKNRKIHHSVSAVYESQKNSQNGQSPKQSKTMQKYKTYIQFITNNKISNNIIHERKHNRQIIKNTSGTPNPTNRKNSPIPYSKGRRSALSKTSQPQSPSNTATFQHNIFAKPELRQQKKQRKQDLLFFVRGNNFNDKMRSQISNQNRKSKMDDRKSRQISNNKSKSKDSKIYKQLNNYQQKQMINIEAPKKNKQQGKNSLKSIDSQYNQKLQKQQKKLCQKLFQGIQFYRDLGRGAHALVRSAVDWNNKRKIAVKVYQKSELNQQEVSSIQRQIQILMSLNHPNIIKLYQIIQTFKTINLMMEYGGGNSLDQFIKSKPEGHLNQRQAKLIFKQIINAVSYLHQMNITHRDIKAQNILLNKHLSLKIIDFGFSLVVRQKNKNITSYCGTPTYMAPEVVSKTPHNPQLADRWSLGVLLFNMLNGCCPFKATTQKQLFAKITKGQYQYVTDVNPLAKDLITKFMNKIPNQRISPKQALHHPWLQPTEKKM